MSKCCIRCKYPIDTAGKRITHSQFITEKKMHRDRLRELLDYKQVQLCSKWITIHTHHFEKHGLDINEVKMLLSLSGYKVFYKPVKNSRKNNAETETNICNI